MGSGEEVMGRRLWGGCYGEVVWGGGYGEEVMGRRLWEGGYGEEEVSCTGGTKLLS